MYYYFLICQYCIVLFVHKIKPRKKELEHASENLLVEKENCFDIGWLVLQSYTREQFAVSSS